MGGCAVGVAMRCLRSSLSIGALQCNCLGIAVCLVILQCEVLRNQLSPSRGTAALTITFFFRKSADKCRCMQNRASPSPLDLHTMHGDEKPCARSRCVDSTCGFDINSLLIHNFSPFINLLFVL